MSQGPKEDEEIEKISSVMIKVIIAQVLSAMQRLAYELPR